MSESVLVVIPTTQAQREEFQAIMPEARFVFADQRDTPPEDPRGFDIILGNVPPASIQASPRLAWMQTSSAGSDAYTRPGVLAPTTLLTCSTGAYGQAVSEHLFASVLAVQRKIELYRDDQRAHVWGDEGAVTSLRGATVLVLGAGDIGSAFARLCQAFGARVVGVRRHPLQPGEPFDRIISLDQVREVLPQADVVVSFLPSTPQTCNLADADFFAAMKPGTIFANGGRGDLVDEDALVEALQSGHLTGAALDVTRTEPLPAESPLWDVPNLLVTPHVAGFYHLQATLDNVVALAQANLRRYAADEPLVNVVVR